MGSPEMIKVARTDFVKRGRAVMRSLHNGCAPQAAPHTSVAPNVNGQTNVPQAEPEQADPAPMLVSSSLAGLRHPPRKAPAQTKKPRRSCEGRGSTALSLGRVKASDNAPKARRISLRRCSRVWAVRCQQKGPGR